MNEHGRSVDGGIDRWAALRRAALAAHWMPGIGLLITQTDHPTLRVATWASETPDGSTIEVHPCEFRRLLIRSADAVLCGFEGLIADDGDVEIQVFTGPDVQLGAFGLMRADLEPDRRVLALVLDGDARAMASEHGLHADLDEELDATLVHVCFDPQHGVVEHQAFEALVDVASQAAATSLIGSVA